MTRKHKIGIAGILAALLLGGGVAVALWSTTGIGTGSAKADTVQTATVTAATGTADLYPGFNGGDVYFTITNPNPFPVEFTSMTAGTVVSSDPVNCPASNVTVTGATGLSLTVPANTTSATQSIADVVTMVLAAPNGCQGVSFSIPLTLAGSQA
jgi:hypothetical protein